MGLLVGRMIKRLCCHVLIRASPTVTKCRELAEEVQMRIFICFFGGSKMDEIVEDVDMMDSWAVRGVVYCKEQVALWFAKNPL